MIQRLVKESIQSANSMSAHLDPKPGYVNQVDCTFNFLFSSQVWYTRHYSTTHACPFKHIYGHSTAVPKGIVCHLGQKLRALTQPKYVTALSTAISGKLINFPFSE